MNTILRIWAILFCGGLTIIQVEAQQDSPFAENFPSIQILKNDSNSPGVLFSRNGIGVERFATIYDTDGTLIFAQRANVITNMNYHPAVNKLSYFDADLSCFQILNAKYELETTLCTTSGSTDIHDLLILPNNHKVAFAAIPVIMDLSSELTLVDTARQVRHFVIEKFTENNIAYVFWNTLNHFDITDLPESIIPNANGEINLLHMNAIEPVNDSIFLISLRTINQIAKINIFTDEVIWRLGGNRNEFTFVNDDRGFTDQHNVRLLPNGNITIFDNGNYHPEPYSSMIEYELDEENMTATLVRRTVSDSLYNSGKKGGGQRLPNGNDFIDWGQNLEPVTATEITPDGETIWSAYFPKSNYRITKYPFKSDVFESTDTLTFSPTNAIQTVEITNQTDDFLVINGYEVKSEYFKLITTLPVEIGAGNTAIFEVEYLANTDTLKDVLTLFSDSEDRRIGHQIFLKTDDNMSSITPLSSASNIKIYPNPVVENLLVNFEKAQTKQVVLYDSNGVKILEQAVNEKQYSLSLKHLQAGIYYLLIEEDGQRFCERVVKL